MSMKPILFNTDEVRAILNGCKTVTRRVVKPQPPATSLIHFEGSGCVWSFWADGSYRQIEPPYRPGDILYVRETWTSECGKFYYRADFESDYLDPCETLSGGYPARCSYHPGCEGCFAEKTRIRWRPSIHIPNQAARIFLRVTNVHVERLQAIENIAAEGITMIPADNDRDPRFYFIQLWDSTIKPADRDRYGWAANPWVWVIAFERCEKPEANNGT